MMIAVVGVAVLIGFISVVWLSFTVFKTYGVLRPSSSTPDKRGTTDGKVGDRIREPCSPADAFHFMTQGGRLCNNNIVICGVLFFHGSQVSALPTADDLRVLWKDRVLHDPRFRRMRQRVLGLGTEAQSQPVTVPSNSTWWQRASVTVHELMPGAGLQWEVLEPEEIDLDKHIVTDNIVEPQQQDAYAPGGEEQQCCQYNCDKKRLEGLLSTMTEARLDATRPLWKVHIVQYAPHCNAVILRVHHSIADGFSLVKFLLATTDQHWLAMKEADEKESETSKLSLQHTDKATPPVPSPRPQLSQQIGDRILLLGRTLRGLPASLWRLSFASPDPAFFLTRPSPVSQRNLRCSFNFF